MTETVKAIFKATVEGTDALLEVYACHEKAISSLILESPSTEIGFKPRRLTQLLTR